MNGSERIIEELRALVAEQAARLEEQAARLEEQAARIAELELALAKAKKDSSTSSKPPSSDLVKPKPKNKKPGRRKKPRRGAQPGHEPEFLFGDIRTNHTASALDNTNGVPAGSEDDVSMALGWDFTLNANEQAIITFLTSLTQPTSSFIPVANGPGQRRNDLL